MRESIREASGESMIDLGDLLSAVVSLKAPSREVDEIVEYMLGGEDIRPAASSRQIVAGRWLSFDTPEYTSGGSPCSLLAHRRGVKLSVQNDGDRFNAIAKCPASGKTSKAAGRTEGIAALSALIGFAAGVVSNV